MECLVFIVIDRFDENLNGLDGYLAQGFMQYLGVQYVWKGNVIKWI